MIGKCDRAVLCRTMLRRTCICHDVIFVQLLEADRSLQMSWVFDKEYAHWMDGKIAFVPLGTVLRDTNSEVCRSVDAQGVVRIVL